MIATMLQVQPDEVDLETPLRLLDNSLGGARLKLGLKRLGLSVPKGASPATFGALLAILSGEAERRSGGDENPTERRAESVGLTGGSKSGALQSGALQSGALQSGALQSGALQTGALQIGLDAQDVRALPVAADYWVHEFYSEMFGKSEIAYAVGHSEPRIHLAGFWSAKEALRKCDPIFTKVAMQSVEVLHDSAGKPHLSHQTAAGAVRLPHVLSLSHTGDLAIAVVVNVPQRFVDPEDRPAPPIASRNPRGVSWLLFIAILAGFIYLLIEQLRRI